MKNFYLLIFLIVSTNLYSQSPEKKIAQALDTLAKFYLKENAFVHTDRETYSAGETIWFKCYLTLDGKPSYLSKVMYVELVNERNEIFEKRMYKLENGVCNGDIKLAEKTAAGTYVINVYTKWMLNFRANVYSKHLFIYNTGIKKTIADDSKVKMDFFPEGGRFISGIKNNLAFKASGENGLPVQVSGEILDSKNAVIAKIESLHDGMGSVEITPLSSEKYTANILLPGGRKKSFALPALYNEGLTLAVANENLSKTFARIERAEQNKSVYNELMAVVILHGELVYIANLNIDEGLDAFSINKKNLPAGVMQIFILDKKGNVLATRNCFVNQNTLQQKQVVNANTDFGKRKLNEITTTLPNSANASLSVSVSNYELSANKFVSDNILSATFLNAELEGYIHQPSFYFRDTSAATVKALDLLMLTTKANKLDYSKIFNHEFPTLIHLVESGLSITGKAVKPGTNTEIKTGRINIWIKGEDSTSILSEAQLTEKGLFMIPGLEFRKSAKVLYQGTNTKREAALVEVKIFPSFFDTLKSAHAKPLVDLNPYKMQASAAAADKMLEAITIKQSADEKVLTEIKIKGKKRSAVDSLNALYASDLFQISDHSFAPDSNVNYIDMWQLLRGRIPGLAIHKTDTGTEVVFSRYANLNQFGNEGSYSVQFFLNEAPVTTDIIEFLDPNDVALVKAFSGNTGIVLGATRGAIAIYTIKGKSTRDWRRKGFDVTEQSGYSIPNNFPFQTHEAKSEPAIENDKRPTLLWVPEIQKDKSGNTGTVRFYNDDNTSKFRIVLQGFDTEGKLYFEEISRQ